jgi:hypothetical protein
MIYTCFQIIYFFIVILNLEKKLRINSFALNETIKKNEGLSQKKNYKKNIILCVVEHYFNIVPTFENFQTINHFFSRNNNNNFLHHWKIWKIDWKCFFL